MEENQRKHKQINLLIPKLLEQSKKYTKVFKDKKKINNIFTEFEMKSSHQFKCFINESNKRYKNMKLGNDLDKLMTISEKNLSKDVNKVLTDKFFTDEGIKKEKENSKYYNSEKYYNTLRDTFLLLKDKQSDTSKTLNNQGNNLLKMKKVVSIDTKETSPNIPLSKDLLVKGKKDINEIFRKEETKILKMFDKYREDVKTLQQIGEQSQEKYASLHKKLEIALPKLEMINYVHYEPPKNVEKDVEKLQKNTLHKILPFTKTFTSNNRNKSNNKTSNIKLQNIFKKLIMNKKSFIPNTDNLNDRRANKNFFNSTSDVVYTTACKELTANNFLDEKRRRLNDVLGYDVPKIGNYKNIIKSKFNDIKKKRNEINTENLMKQKYASMTYYDKLNLRINNELYQLTQVEKDLFENQMEKKNN